MYAFTTWTGCACDTEKKLAGIRQHPIMPPCLFSTLDSLHIQFQLLKNPNSRKVVGIFVDFAEKPQGMLARRQGVPAAARARQGCDVKACRWPGLVSWHGQTHLPLSPRVSSSMG
jgi:hypothetical protein